MTSVRDHYDHHLASVYTWMAGGGRLILTFRDYSKALTGAQKFIPVRSDERRILTCFLEYGESRVRVHDLLHEWDGKAWQFSVSDYEKLRLSPDWLIESLEKNGFTTESGTGAGGMIRIVARRH